jgi:hypothetical protein
LLEVVGDQILQVDHLQELKDQVELAVVLMAVDVVNQEVEMVQLIQVVQEVEVVLVQQVVQAVAELL